MHVFFSGVLFLFYFPFVKLVLLRPRREVTLFSVLLGEYGCHDDGKLDLIHSLPVDDRRRLSLNKLSLLIYIMQDFII